MESHSVCPRCCRSVDGGILKCANCGCPYCVACRPDWGQCEECQEVDPFRVAVAAPPVLKDRPATHSERRRAVFERVCEVLEREEADWARVEGRGTHRFQWTWGVRCASELAIGYMATKLFLLQRLDRREFVWPERPLCQRE